MQALNDDVAAARRGADADLDFSAITAAIRRRAKWIILPTLIAFALSTAFVQFFPPRYRSEARLIVEPGETAFTRPENDRNTPSDRVIDEQGVGSQVQIIQSRDVARMVVDKLGLKEMAEFGGEEGGLSKLLRIIGLGPSKAVLEDRVLTAFYERLLVYQVEKSRIIAVAFTSRDPALAAKVANQVVETYLAFQQDAKRDATRNATAWLESEIQQLRKRVADAEARVESFRAQAGLLVGTNNTTINAQQLSEMNTELLAARAQEAELKARAKLLRDILAQGRTIESRDIAQSEMLRRLFDQRVATRGALAEQSTTLLDSHPRIRELRAQLADLDRQIRTETEKLVRQLETDARIAAARVQALTASAEELRKRAATGNEQDVQLRALEREAKAQRDLLENYLARFRDASARVNDAALTPDARIISRAAESNVPAFPKKLPTILIATLGALALALGLIVTGALLGAVGQPAAQMRPEDEGEEPVAADPPPALPALPLPRLPQLTMQPVSDPNSFEWVASLLAAEAGPTGGTLIVGTDRGANAEQVAVSLARWLAKSDVVPRVLLVDLDPTGPIAALTLNDRRAPGLLDAVAARVSFGSIVHRDRVSRLHVVPRGQADGIDGESAGDRLGMIMDALKRSYDHVIIACAPMTEAIPLGAVAELGARALLLSTERQPDAAEVSALKTMGVQRVLPVHMTSTEPQEPSTAVA